MVGYEKHTDLIMGSIYQITNTVDGKIYVGQTCREANKRWKQHQKAAEKLRRYQLGEIQECDNRSILYYAMIKYGIDNFKFEVIEENIDDLDLDALEIAHIKMLNTLKPNGYNMTTGGGHFTHHPDTKKLMSDLAIAAAPSLIDKYRKEETKGLPMYIVYHNKGSRGYAINEHPLCSYKSFTLTNYPSMDDCRLAAAEFLADLEEEGVVKKFTKKRLDLPTGITTFRNGYLAKRKVNGTLYKKAFGDSTLADEVNLQAAKDYLSQLPTNQRTAKRK